MIVAAASADAKVRAIAVRDLIKSLSSETLPESEIVGG